MLTLPASVRVFVARGATDLRRSFDRLSAQVQELLHQDPLSAMFLPSSIVAEIG